MERVEDWFIPFVIRHRARCHREDWPSPADEVGREFYLAWMHALETRGVDRHSADLASIDMAAEPPRFLSDHLPTLLRRAIAKQPSPAQPPSRSQPEDVGDEEGRREALEALKATLAASKRDRGARPVGERREAALRRLAERTASGPLGPVDRSWVTPDPFLDEAAKPSPPPPPAQPSRSVVVEGDLEWFDHPQPPI